LRHLEHVDGRLAAEHRLEHIVGLDHPLVLLVLQAILLDVGPEFLVTSVRGIGFEPTTSDSTALGCTGFMKAAFGFRLLAAFFAMSSPCEGRASSPWCNSICIRPSLHPVWLRCSSLKYSRYSRSSRLASRA